MLVTTKGGPVVGLKTVNLGGLDSPGFVYYSHAQHETTWRVPESDWDQACKLLGAAYGAVSAVPIGAVVRITKEA
jgi:hypothetical protein